MRILGYLPQKSSQIKSKTLIAAQMEIVSLNSLIKHAFLAIERRLSIFVAALK